MTRPWERRGKAALPGWTSTIPTEKPRSRTERHASRSSFAPSPWFSPSMPWTCPTGRRRASAGRTAPSLERARTSPSTTWGSPAPQIPPLCAQCRYVVRFIFLKFCLRVCSLRIAEGTSDESVLLSWVTFIRKPALEKPCVSLCVWLIFQGAEEILAGSEGPLENPPGLRLRLWTNEVHTTGPDGK